MPAGDSGETKSFNSAINPYYDCHSYFFLIKNQVNYVVWTMLWTHSSIYWLWWIQTKTRKKKTKHQRKPYS